MKRFLNRAWGNAFAFLNRSKSWAIVDLLLLGGVAGMIFGLLSFERAATSPATDVPLEINLSPWALPTYTFYSLTRGVIAYALSLGFTLLYGYWAAKDKIARRILIPLLDILQSIPVLAFLPVLLITLKNLIPGSKFGLELAAIVMIFTGQAWNMTFSFYHSLNSIPSEQLEASAVYRFNWWQRFKWVELPSSMMGLVWNSMMSMAGGWFFLSVSEAFKLDNKDFRLPGIGAYMSVANANAETDPNGWHYQLWAIVAMSLMIVILDQFLWRPVVVWAQKFRVEEGGAQDNASSWFLDFLRRSRILSSLAGLFKKKNSEKNPPVMPSPRAAEVRIDVAKLPDVNKPNVLGQALSLIVFLSLSLGLLWGGWKLFMLMRVITLAEWRSIGEAALYTLGRVLAATVIGTLWTLPAGLAIGLSPKLSRFFQPIVQVVASFPAPMLFAIVLAGLKLVGVSLGWGSMFLMLLGTQWYILFNVIAGAMAIPADLKEMSRSFKVSGWQRFWVLYVPAVFPYLVTGWVTAAGGAWNASIVSEYISESNYTIGLGAEISRASNAENNALLAASVVVMSAIVVLFNNLVWKRCYKLAETRYSLSK